MKKFIFTKVLSPALILLILLSAVAISPVTVAALESGNYRYELLEDGTAEITQYIGKEKDIIVPEKIDGYKVTSIGDRALSYHVEGATLVINDNIKRIGKEAFHFSDYTTITIGSGVESIGEGAFEYDTELTAINVSADNKKFSSEDGVLFNKSKSEIIAYPEGKTDAKYKIPSSVKSIAEDAFYYSQYLTGVTIPDSVTSIGYAAFRSCEKLTSVKIPAGVTSIGTFAFENCHSLTAISVVQDNPNYSSKNGVLFNKAKSNLIKYPEAKADTEYKIPDSVKTISCCAFNESNNLLSVTIPDSVEEIEFDAFEYCYNLKSVSIGNGVTRLDNSMFYACDSLDNVIVPEGVTYIGFLVFGMCKDLTSITIPRSVTSIDDTAFRYSENVIIYGYKGSYAETYANEYGIMFIALDDLKEGTLTDKKTNITVSVTTHKNAQLSAKKVTDKESIKKANIALGNEERLVELYDISLVKGSDTLQPYETATVKIPTENADVKVYRIEADGTKTDMNAVFKDGYMVFTTNHFSLYALAEENSGVMGDADMDGELNIKDATQIQMYLATFISEDEINLSVSDVNDDGEVNVKDATSIQMILAGYINF